MKRRLLFCAKMSVNYEKDEKGKFEFVHSNVPSWILKMMESYVFRLSSIG